MKRVALVVSILCASVLVFAMVAVGAQAKTTASSDNGAWPSMITYYTANDGTNFMRSTKPFTSGVATQNHRGDTITVGITNTSGYADSGVVVYNGTLANLPDFTLNGTGAEYGLNLWFDVNNDGEYFAWSGNTLTDLGDDIYGLGPSSVGGVLTVNDASTFFLTPGGGTYTLTQLKAGDATGISSDTHVAIWVGVSGADKSATIAPPKSAK